MGSGAEQRLRRVVLPRLEITEEIVAWSPAWVSRWGRLNHLLAARNRDFAVVTDRRLMLWSTGFFTRRPRRRVLTERLDDIEVESIGPRPGRKLLCRKPGLQPLLLELGGRERARTVAAALLGGAVEPHPVETPEPGDTSAEPPEAAIPSRPDQPDQPDQPDAS